jgi:predicted enzyme related to lactoylglutathione lyase
MLLYTSDPDAVRATFRDVFGFAHLDAGDGWLIFALPPAELGIHPADPTASSKAGHQLTFMCDNIETTIGELRARGIEINRAPKDEGWGITAMMTLPGGVELMLYEPRHPVVIGSQP